MFLAATLSALMDTTLPSDSEARKLAYDDMINGGNFADRMEVVREDTQNEDPVVVFGFPSSEYVPPGLTKDLLNIVTYYMVIFKGSERADSQATALYIANATMRRKIVLSQCCSQHDVDRQKFW